MNTEWLLEGGFERPVAALFVAGYVTAWTAIRFLPVLSAGDAAMRRAARLIVAFLVLLAFLTPFLSPISSSVAIVAALVMWGAGEMRGAAGSRKLLLAGLHAVVLIAGMAVLALQPESGLYYDYWVEHLGRITRIGVVAGILILNTALAAQVVTAVLSRYRLTGGRRSDGSALGSDDVARGRAIGILERLLVVTLVLLQQWAAIGLVIAAKSIARFRALEDRDFGEYYLIGTLTSILIAVLTSVAALLLI